MSVPSKTCSLHCELPVEPHVLHRLQLVLASSAVLGLTINHSTFLCTQVNEPLMTSVAGNLKNVLMVRTASCQRVSALQHTVYA